MGDYCTFIQNDDTKEPYILRKLKYNLIPYYRYEVVLV